MNQLQTSVRHVLLQVQRKFFPDGPLQCSGEALTTLVDQLTTMIDGMLRRLPTGDRTGRPVHLKDAQFTVLDTVSRRIAPHASDYGMRRVKQYERAGEEMKGKSSKVRAGLLMSTTPIRQLAQVNGYKLRVEAQVFMTGVVEYLLQEWLVATGNRVRESGRTEITHADLQNALQEDQDLAELVIGTAGGLG